VWLDWSHLWESYEFYWFKILSIFRARIRDQLSVLLTTEHKMHLFNQNSQKIDLNISILNSNWIHGYNEQLRCTYFVKVTRYWTSELELYREQIKIIIYTIGSLNSKRKCIGRIRDCLLYELIYSRFHSLYFIRMNNRSLKSSLYLSLLLYLIY